MAISGPPVEGPADKGPSVCLGYEAEEGIVMIIRWAIVTAAALSCAACANQGQMQPMGLGFHGQINSYAAPAQAEKPALPKLKQTLGGKVLSAIALERVTGRKPDPRRFNELR